MVCFAISISAAAEELQYSRWKSQLSSADISQSFSEKTEGAEPTLVATQEMERTAQRHHVCCGKTSKNIRPKSIRMVRLLFESIDPHHMLYPCTILTVSLVATKVSSVPIVFSEDGCKTSVEDSCDFQRWYRNFPAAAELESVIIIIIIIILK